MNKHTPGPWDIHFDRQDNEIYGKITGATITVEPNTAIARVCGIDTNEHDERLANARLIAAAPELLEALREIMRECDENHSVLAKARAYSIARAAIAKATGNTI